MAGLICARSANAGPESFLRAVIARLYNAQLCATSPAERSTAILPRHRQTRRVTTLAASRATTNRTTAGRLYVIDLLRFCAAAFVLTFHLVPVTAEAYNVTTSTFFGPFVSQLSRYGYMGVDLFFLISGFVICMSSWGRSPSQFFTSRVARLMPVYVLAVLLTSAVFAASPTPGQVRPDLRQLFANLTMMQGLLGERSIDAVCWTLLVEFKFYLLFLIVVWAGANYRRVVFFCLAWSVASLFALYSQFPLLTAVVEPAYSAYFIAGITLYLIYRFGPNLLLWCMLAVSYLLCTMTVTGMVADKVKLGEPINLQTAMLFLTVFYLAMTATALGWFSWVRWRGLVVVGALTYPLYLLHFEFGANALRKLSRRPIQQWLVVLLFLAGLLLFCYLLHRFYERPVAKFVSRRLGRSFDQIREQSQSRVLARIEIPAPRVSRSDDGVHAGVLPPSSM